MAFDLHPIICTWDVVTTCIPVTVFFPLSEMRTYQLACCTTSHCVHPQRFWWQQHFLTTSTSVSQSALPEHSHTATSLPPLADYKPLQDCCGDGCGLVATDRNETISELWPFIPRFQTSVNALFEVVPCGQEGQCVTWLKWVCSSYPRCRGHKWH